MTPWRRWPGPPRSTPTTPRSPPPRPRCAGSIRAPDRRVRPRSFRGARGSRFRLGFPGSDGSGARRSYVPGARWERCQAPNPRNLEAVRRFDASTPRDRLGASDAPPRFVRRIVPPVRLGASDAPPRFVRRIVPPVRLGASDAPPQFVRRIAVRRIASEP